MMKNFITRFNSYPTIMVGILCLLFLQYDLSAQDLLERAKNNENISYATSANKLNDLVDQRRGESSNGSRLTGLFTLSESIPIVQEDSPELDINQAIFLDLDVETLQSLRSSRFDFITLSIPASRTSSITLELVPVNIHAPDYLAVSSSGAVLPSNGVYYRGVVQGIANSTVAITLSDGELSGLISDDFGNYNLGKLKTSDTYAIYNADNLRTQLSDFCGVEYDGFRSEIEETINNTNDNTRSADIVNVHIECDFAMYGNFANDANAVTTFTNNIFNEMATVFFNEGITINLKFLKVWDTSDPYTGTTTNQVLNNFISELPNNAVQGDMAHVFSGKSTDGGGLAQTPSSSLCNFTPYAVTMLNETTFNPFPTYSNWVVVATHEMGHNFGSPHTHSCAWGPNNNLAIDNCVSTGCGLVTNPTPDKELATIMSYCHIGTEGTVYLNKGFGTEPGDLIRAKVAASVSCLDDCTTAPTADFINPQVICVGGTVTYNSLTNCADNQSWTFTGGSPSSSTDLKPEITYNTAGTFIATATASNSIGSDSDSKYIYVQNAPSGASNISGTGSMGGITFFSLSNISNSSDAAISAKYEDFSCEHIAILDVNTEYTLRATYGEWDESGNGNHYFERIKAYIDYNGNGDFSDANEQITSFTGGSVGTRPLSFTTISTPTTNQLLRLRVIVDGQNITGPDYIPANGQVEEYSVFFGDGSVPTSNCPAGLATTNAPAVVISSESACAVVGGNPSGGLLSAPSSSCPAGSTLGYSTDGGNTFNPTIPTYHQTMPITVITRCTCDNDAGIVSLESSVTTTPGTCPTDNGDLGDGECEPSMILSDSDVPGSAGIFRAETTIITATEAGGNTGGNNGSSNVTFSVDMNGYNGSFTQVYVSGNLNGWSGEANPLTDVDGDGIWSSVISLNNGSYEYLYSLDNWAAHEQLTPGTECTVTFDVFTNRLIEVTGDTEVCFAWNTCTSCGGTGGPVTISSGETVSFLAGASVTLNPGFHAESGSIFLADIEDCAPVPH